MNKIWLPEEYEKTPINEASYYIKGRILELYWLN